MKKNDILKNKLEVLAELLNIATTSEVYSDTEKEEGNHNKFYKREFLSIDYYNIYGGYKIVKTGVNGSSGQWEPFGSKRYKYNEFLDFLNTLILSIQIGNGITKI